MHHYTVQTSSNTDTHSDELQLAVLTQQNKRLQRDSLPLEAKHYQHQDELNLLLNVAKQLKYHYLEAEQQSLLSLPDEASQVSRTAFLSYLIEIYGAQLTKGPILFICDPLTDTYNSLVYEYFLIHYQTHYLNSLTEFGQKYNPWIERMHFEKLLLNFLNVSLPHLILPLNNHERRAYTKSLDKK